MTAISWVIVGAGVVTWIAPMLSGGMLDYVAPDGTLEFYKDSTGSNSETDINLMATLVLFPLVVLRAVDRKSVV